MLNESKIKLMTGISMIEKDKGKDLAIVHRYFKGDYIGRHMLCAFLGYTFCWCLGLLLVAACKVEEWFSLLSLKELADYFVGYAAWYAAGLLVYLVITFIVYFIRYRRASLTMRRYLERLKNLERRYEFQGKIKEPGREVRKS